MDKGTIESDEEDAELIAVLKAWSKHDVEDADDSITTVPWTLRQAREDSEGMTIFLRNPQLNGRSSWA